MKNFIKIEKAGAFSFKIILKNIQLSLYYFLISILTFHTNYSISSHIYNSIFIEFILLFIPIFLLFIFFIYFLDIRKFKKAQISFNNKKIIKDGGTWMYLNSWTIILIMHLPFIWGSFFYWSISNFLIIIILVTMPPLYTMITILTIYHFFFHSHLSKLFILKIILKNSKNYYKIIQNKIFYYIGRIKVFQNSDKFEIIDKTINRIINNYIYIPLLSFGFSSLIISILDFFLITKMIFILLFTVYTLILLINGYFKISKYKKLDKNYQWIIDMVKEFDENNIF